MADLGKRPNYVKQQEVETERPESSTPPFIKVLQALSPEIDEDSEKYIDGAKKGQLLITSGSVGGVNIPEERLIDGKKGLQFIPLASRKKWVEYSPRSAGGGFVAVHDTREDMERDYVKGNEIVPTIEYMVALPDFTADEGNLAVLTFSGPSKMAIARKLADNIQKYETLSGMTYKLIAVKVDGKKGSYYNFGIEPAAWTEKAMFESCEALSSDMAKIFALPGGDDEI